MKTKCISVLVFLLFLSMLSASFIPKISASTKDEAELAIKSSEERILECYLEVLEAERAGADVKQLLIVLNEAGGLLAKARLAYREGDFSVAKNLAHQSLRRLDGFTVRAEALRDAASREGFYDFMVNFVGSISGAVALVLFSFFLWRFLERKYGDEREAL